MMSSRWLTECVSVGLAVGLCGCGGGSAPTAPQATAPTNNRAPGAAAVVGVDATMGETAYTPPADNTASMSTPPAAEAEYTPPSDNTVSSAATGLQETPGAVGTNALDPAQMLAGAAQPGDASYTPPGTGLTEGAGQPAPGQPISDGIGGPQGQSAQQGSPEYAVATFFAMTQSGNYSASEEIISSKAKGTAGAVRMGDLPDERVDEYKACFANPQFLSTRNTGTGIQVVYATLPGETATFILAKEGTKYVIKELKLTSSKGR